MMTQLFAVLLALSGLTASTTAKSCETPINLILVLDRTYNLDKFQFKQAKRFVNYFIEAFNVSEDGTNVALMTIGDKGKRQIITNFDDKQLQNSLKLKDRVNKIKYQGVGTNLIFTLQDVHNKIVKKLPGERKSFSTLMIFIGRGRQWPDADLSRYSKPIRYSGVQVFALATGFHVNIKKLVEITDSTTRVFATSQIHSLYKAVRRIKEIQCPRPICKKPIDLAIVLDTSGSIGKRNMKRLKKFAERVVDSFEISPNKTRIAVITFNEDVDLLIGFGDHTAREIKSEIRKIKRTSKATHIDKALNMVNTRVFTKANIRPEAEQLCLLVTDGKQTYEKFDNKTKKNPDILKNAVKPLHDRGVVMFAVGITDSVDLSELKTITGNSERVVFANDFKILSTKINELRMILCETCRQPVDLALLLDHSGSISKEDWQKTLDLTSTISYSYNICKKDTRVALVTFSNKAKLQIGFNNYANVQLNNDGVDRKVQELIHLKILEDKNDPKENRQKFQAQTFIDKALQLANNEVFTERAGMRSESLKVSVVFTDGNQTNFKNSLLYNAAQPLKDKGVHVFVLAMGPEEKQHKQGLGEIASSPCKTYIIQEKAFTLLPAKIAQSQAKRCKRSSIPRCRSRGATTLYQSVGDQDESDDVIA